MSAKNNTINYIELPSTDLDKTKKFYGDLFGWSFTDWGDDYISFEGAGIDGGFTTLTTSQPCGVLVVLYSDNLETCLDQVTAAGGVIVKPIFEFPGGRRFQFTDPSGNELAVWSDVA